jgi:hypothetical protein
MSTDEEGSRNKRANQMAKEKMRREMTPESMKLAMAEACGWKCVAKREHPLFDGQEVLSGWDSRGQFRAIPDWPNDLNALAQWKETI